MRFFRLLRKPFRSSSVSASTCSGELPPCDTTAFLGSIDMEQLIEFELQLSGCVFGVFFFFLCRLVSTIGVDLVLLSASNKLLRYMWGGEHTSLESGNELGRKFQLRSI